MKTIEIIRQQLGHGDFEFSRHAFKRTIERNISELEIQEAGENAIIIESYPADKYSPSCLLLGMTANDRPLHLQVSQAETELVKIITIYEPDPDQWINLMDRR
jgi:Domain of unknown function (DUF4258)